MTVQIKVTSAKIEKQHVAKFEVEVEEESEADTTEETETVPKADYDKAIEEIGSLQKVIAELEMYINDLEHFNDLEH